MRRTISAILLLLTAFPAAAQQAKEPTAYDRAIAAGYKAAMLCSGIFNAGRTEAQIEADELKGIYPEYDAIVPTLKAKVDYDTGIVTVDFSATLPPRIAQWRPGFGCFARPIGAAGPPIAMRLDRSALRLDPTPWPGGDATAPILTPPPLTRLVGFAFDGKSYGDNSKTAGVVVLRDGRIVAEQYAPGFGPLVSNRTWSVAKSIAGTLVGIAVKNSIIDPEAPASIFQWRAPADPRGMIALDQLLRMASGLHSDSAGNRTDAIYFGGASATEAATGGPLEAAPGTRFRYSNNDILLAMLALRNRLGDKRYAAFPADELFTPLGMKRTVAERDWQDNYILSSQVWSTARDLARLGQFWLQDGVWEGKRILPQGWMKYMTTPSGPQPASGPGYGATLWLFGPAQGLPEGSYAAQGNRGQFVMVIPSKKLVIVRRGEDPGQARFDIAKFTADVIAALP